MLYVFSINVIIFFDNNNYGYNLLFIICYYWVNSKEEINFWIELNEYERVKCYMSENIYINVN